MAEFFARLVPKKSTQPGEVPNPDLDLVVGEIAVNTADGKIFTKHTDGSLKEISGSGGGGGIGGDSILRRSADFWGNQKKATDTPGDVVGLGAFCERTDINGLTLSEFSADGSRWMVDEPYGDGDSISVWVNDIENVFTISGAPVRVVDQFCTFTFAEDTTALNNLINGSETLQIGLTTAPPVNGDVLVWSEECQCWLALDKNALPYPVKSVAGKTGDVLLTLEDVQSADDWIVGGEWGGGMPVIGLLTGVRGRLWSFYGYGQSQGGTNGNDPNNVDGEFYDARFGEMLPYLPLNADGKFPGYMFTDTNNKWLYPLGSNGPVCDFVLPFDTGWPRLYLGSGKGCWSGDYSDFDFAFEREDNSIVFVIRTRKKSTYSNNMFYGYGFDNLTQAATAGSWPNAYGHFTWSTTQLFWTPTGATNCINAWQNNAVAMDEVDHIRVTYARSVNSYNTCGTGIFLEVQDAPES